MKNKLFSLILGIIALIQVIYSFFNDATTDRILTFEINIWLYRFVWFLVTIGFFYDYYRSSKKV